MTEYLYPADEANNLLQETVKELAKAEGRIEKMEAVADRAGDVHWAYVNKEQLSYRMTLLGKALAALDAKEEAQDDQAG